MPQIREYDQRQEARTGVGDTSRVSADSFGASTGRSLEQVGRSVNQLGNQLQRQQEQDEINDITQAMASAQAEATVRLNDDINRGAVDSEKFIDGLDERFGSLSGNYSTRAAQEYFNQATGKLKNHFIVSAASASAEQAGNRAKISFVEASNKQQASLINDPSAFQLSLQTMEDGLKARVATGSLPAADAEKLRLATAREYAKAAIRGWSKLNPEDAKAQIDQGLWDNYLDGDSKKQMLGEADMGISGRRAEQERTQAAALKARAEAQRTTLNKFMPAIVNGSQSVDEVLSSNLDPEDKYKVIGWISQSATNSPAMKTNPALFNEVFSRVHLPDGDPKKIYDDKQLLNYVGKGISLEDVNKLRNEIQGDNTEEGKSRAALKASMLNAARAKLVRKDTMMGVADFNGEENYQRFLVQYQEDYKAGKAKGLSDNDLFNPDSKDYLGKSIDRFYKTPQQRLQEDAARRKQQRPPPANPDLLKKDGESIADFRKRTEGLKTKETNQ